MTAHVMPDRSVSAPPRAKDVSVEKIFRARCHLPGCEDWRGDEHPDFQGANTERQAHLNQHILSGPGTVPEAAVSREPEAGL